MWDMSGGELQSFCRAIVEITASNVSTDECYMVEIEDRKSVV